MVPDVAVDDNRTKCSWMVRAFAICFLALLFAGCDHTDDPKLIEIVDVGASSEVGSVLFSPITVVLEIDERADLSSLKVLIPGQDDVDITDQFVGAAAGESSFDISIPEDITPEMRDICEPSEAPGFDSQCVFVISVSVDSDPGLDSDATTWQSGDTSPPFLVALAGNDPKDYLDECREAGVSRLILAEKTGLRGDQIVVYERRVDAGGAPEQYGDIPDLDAGNVEYNDIASSAILEGPPGTVVRLFDKKNYGPDDDVVEISIPDGETSVRIDSFESAEPDLRRIGRSGNGINGKVSSVMWPKRGLSCLPPDEYQLWIARRFAPEIRLHHEDRYRPSSVGWYLDRVSLRWHRPSFLWAWQDVEILASGSVTADSLVNQVYKGNRSGGGRSTSSFFLDIPNGFGEEATRSGDLRTAEVYVNFRTADAVAPSYDITYWFFYPYNGDITSVLDPAHQGDWEHVTVRVDSLGRNILEVFFATHKRESRWYADFSTNSDGRPIGYSAYHSHATYPTIGIQRRGAGLPDDVTSALGPVWETWNSLSLLGSFEEPAPGNEWLTFRGRWGEIGAPVFGNLLVTSAPYGPAFQPWWYDDNEMIN